VFCLHPHQDRFRVAADAVLPLPGGVPAARAVLAANAETALNAIWDAELGPGERVLVLGAGLLGCLIAAFLSRIHGTVDVTDKLSEPGARLADFPVNFVSGGAVGDHYDVIFHSTASAAGLQAALQALAFEGRVVELSWFGDREVALGLGGRFHSRRLTIRASQVGHVAPARRGTTSRRARLAEALALLADPRLDALITEEVAFADLPAALPRLLAPDAPGTATRVRY
jgi:threonine dehydrogenase-like Zn-dependent dehydrogenase